MASVIDKHKQQKSNVVADGGCLYDDALFVVHVQPKEEWTTENILNANDAYSTSSSSSVLTAFMPGGAAVSGGKTQTQSPLPLVVGDARGGMSARQPSRVQLFTKGSVSLALFSHTLAAEAVADAFIECRDAHIHDPRARARALKAMLKDLHDEEHVFSLAAFDDSARAFVAWTPRSAPISFGHHVDGSVVVVGSLPRSKSLVGKQMNGEVQLAHLPAGRFVYGHAFLKPFEFTSMWSTATGNRAGASAQVVLQPAPTLQTVDPTAAFDLDKPKLSPQQSIKWRWTKTGSRAEVSPSWKKTVSAVVAEAEVEQVAEEPKAPSAASQIAAVAEAVAARNSAASSATNVFIAQKNAAAFVSPAVLPAPAAPAAPAAVDWAVWPKENPALAAAASKILPPSPSPSLSPSAVAAAAAAAGEQLLTFGVGAIICHVLANSPNRIHRFDTAADKRFMTLLLLRRAVLTKSPFISPEERRALMLGAIEQAQQQQELLLEEPVSLGSVAAAAKASFAGTMRKTAAAWGAASAAGSAAKRRSNELLQPKRRTVWPVANADGNGSSIVVCQLNGTCCVGSHCFV